MKKLSSLIAFLIIGTHLTTSALAATIIPCEISGPKLLISKFSFNSITDFVEISVIDDGHAGSGTLLNNWKLSTIDSTLKTLTNFPIRTGESYSLKDIPGLTATTDQLAIFDDTGKIQDTVCWVSVSPTEQEKNDFLKLESEWNGTISSCISSSSLEKETIFSRNAGIDTNTSSDWKKQANLETPTPIEPPPEEVMPSLPVATSEVIINEIFADPEGSDENKEWIELKNTSDHPVSLSGWQLDDIEGGSKPYAFKDETIGSESFLLMSNSITNVTLNNTSDAARLINSDGKTVSQYAYAKAETGKSWARMKNGEWELAVNTTPGEENESPESIEADAESNETETGAPGNPDGPVDVSEVFPNPEGADTGSEWIEIHNSSEGVLDLSGWKIKNAAGKTFTFPESVKIEAHGYIIISDQTTKIQLKNTGDQVQLIDADGEIQDTIEFESAPENVSFANIATVGVEEEKVVSWKEWLIPRAHAQSLNTNPNTTEESQWEWTDMITKGKPNPIYYRIAGSITRELDERNSFDIKKNGKTFTIQVDPKKIQLDLIKAIVKKGEEIEITAIEKEGALVLETYKTKNGTSAPESSSILTPLLISIGIILVAAGGWFLKIKLTHDPASSEPSHTPVHISQEEPLPWSEPMDQKQLLGIPRPERRQE